MPDYTTTRPHIQDDEIRKILARIYRPKMVHVPIYRQLHSFVFCRSTIELVLLATFGMLVGAGLAVATEEDPLRAFLRPPASASVDNTQFSEIHVSQLDRLMFYNGAAFKKSVLAIAEAEPHRPIATPSIETCSLGGQCNEHTRTSSVDTIEYTVTHPTLTALEGTPQSHNGRNYSIPPLRSEHLSELGGEGKEKRSMPQKKIQSSLQILPNRIKSGRSGASRLQQDARRLVAVECKKTMTANGCPSSRKVFIYHPQGIKKLSI